MTLPSLQITYSCGACGDELANDGLTRCCYACGLEYNGNPMDRPEAEFTEEVNPCGHPGSQPVTHRRPFRTVHGVTVEWRTTTVTYEPCSLPSDHETMFHYHHASSTQTYDTGEAPA